ncbi:tryptophan-rich sensory protein [Paenibacillus athensensis]|uniref:Tryptophan-rich sensory protein n=1 Tax=Paenibacillus athensensis TaxID=1967502 RepID=A0A4Y8Q811_9BACL|nr:TspO/MBR family protein [Paenibacillus athensensis]MCD1257312.1 tryptophan-rich sensory protein [Paenibacillus athensensis]
MVSWIVTFLVVYALFSVSGVLFPVDRPWYASLNKPAWNPPAPLFGVVWGILYALIALSVTIVYHRTDSFQTASAFYVTVLFVNYVANQAFSFFQFKLHSLTLAFWDTLLVAVTTFLLLVATIPYSKAAAWLLVPYLLWTCFATFLAWTILRLNPQEARAS